MTNKNQSTKTLYKAQIHSKEKLSSGFIRLRCFHNHPELNKEHKGGYIKLILDADAGKTKKRSISIYQASPDLLVLDFVDHGQTGPAATWARNAKIGDEFEFLGPGPAADTDLDSPHFRFIGDRTAFPAIHQQLTRLDSADFKSCEIALLVNDESEGLYFDGFLNRERFHFKIMCEVEPNDYIDSLPSEGLSFWAAGERETIKAIKKELKKRDLTFTHKYISSYWQPGKDQEEHSFLKKEDEQNDD